MLPNAQSVGQESLVPRDVLRAKLKLVEIVRKENTLLRSLQTMLASASSAPRATSTNILEVAGRAKGVKRDSTWTHVDRPRNAKHAKRGSTNTHQIALHA